MIEVLRTSGRSLRDPASYADVMQALPNLKGEVMDSGGNAVEVSGHEFWLSGAKGVATQFSGDTGRKRLSVLIRGLLPRPVEEVF